MENLSGMTGQILIHLNMHWNMKPG